jgi:hypothetical protein
MVKRSTPIFLVACALLVLCAPASAKIVHPFLSSFNGSDTPHKSLGLPLAVAVDNSAGLSSGDVYIGGPTGFVEPSAVYKFDEKGAFAGVEFTGAETPQGSFGFVNWNTFEGSRGLAVDGSAGASHGDVYVADVEHNVVDRFNEAGKYLCQITGTATPSVSECAGATGSKTANGLFTPTGVAVDPVNGYIYVSSTSAPAVIDEFNGAGEYIGQIADSHLTQPASIAFNSLGELYVVNSSLLGNQGNAVKFAAKGVSVIDSSSSDYVAVDPSSNHAYVYRTFEQEQTAEYDSAGGLVGTFGSEQKAELGSVAVSSSTGKVYVTSFSGQAFIYGRLVLPDVTTGQATSVQETSAHLNGHVDPDAVDGGGEVTSCKFEYGTSTSYGQTAPCSPATPYASATDVSAPITALSPGTTTHFRLAANNSNGVVNYGQDQMLSTFGPPAVDSESSSQVSAHTAVLGAQINPFGYDTNCQVQYVDDASFQSSGYAGATTLPCTPSDLGFAFGDRGAGATPSGLAIGTTYHYRFIATNEAGTTTGTDHTFATFGVESFKVETLDREGHPYTQAGGHPYELTTTFALNATTSLKGPTTDENVKDIRTELPRGLIGNPTATARCTRAAVPIFQCPGNSQVGIVAVHSSGGNFEEPVYNLIPPGGDAAEFGARFSNALTGYIDFHVRTGGDYGVNADVLNISTEGGSLFSISLTIWGVPADPSHDPDRFCSGFDSEGHPLRGCSTGAALVPFLTNPTSCAGPQTATLLVDSWQHPGEFVSATSTLPAFTGCDRPDFTPSITLQPDTSVADSPSGLNIKLSVPQNENPYGLAEANLKEAAVALPAGISVSPSAANGLAACSPEQIAIDNAKEPACPEASKIGAVEVNTPLLPNKLTGGVYVAKQNNNPFGSLLAIYVTAEDPVSGALVKLAGHVVADPLTGQLTTTFANNPQLPFSDFKLDFFGGPRAALATPESCGTVSANTALTPWSETGTVSLPEPLTFSSGCVSGFAPAFTAGVTNPQAGAFSPFVLSFSRQDTDQELAGLSVSLPPGLLAKIAGVPLCSDAALAVAASNSGAAEQANPSCPAGSQVGTVQTGAGAGPDPLFLTGKAYLTSPYKGAPYGLAVIVPAVAGPYDLGTVVVRQSLRIDPHTAQVTAVSDSFPTVLKGIPIRLRRVDATIDRPGFTFNPTNCEPLSVNGTLTNTQGTSANVSSRFQAANCAMLPFKPKFSVLTQAKTSRRVGAGIQVKLAYPRGSFGNSANVKSVHVALPKQLPSRLTTLQKACPDSVFNANPATCPQGSKVGTAKAITPILPVPLEGPAYFVSHGGKQFPELVMVLQGYGVTVELQGEVFIKNGVTTSTFRHVPDVPVSTFELNLPQGPNSALAANGNLCKTRLAMPTTITGQNGAVIKQSTKIAVSGCLVHRAKQASGRLGKRHGKGGRRKRR